MSYYCTMCGQPWSTHGTACRQMPVAAPVVTQPVAVSSSPWMDALAQEWERIANQNDHLSARLGKYNLGFAEGLRFCINDMRRAYRESVSIVALQPPRT
jgi:hypothetical protein